MILATGGDGFLQARYLLTAGMLGVSTLSNASARGPDVHMIRQGRGDVMVVRGADGSEHAGVQPRRPVRVGQRLPSAAYAARDVVAAPRGLPRARGTLRWIRRGDDLLLVNTRGGRVERVVPGGYRSTLRTQAAR